MKTKTILFVAFTFVALASTLPDLYRELLTTQPDDTATTQTGRLADFGQPIPEDRAPD